MSAVCGFVIGSVLLFLPDKGPALNGRSLSDLIWDTLDFNRPPSNRHPERTDAGKEIIRNAPIVVPVLLRWHAARDSETGTGVFLSLPYGLQSGWLRHVLGADADKKHLLAELGFQILGTNALPYLQVSLTNSNPTLRDAAAEVMSAITKPSNNFVSDGK